MVLLEMVHCPGVEHVCVFFFFFFFFFNFFIRSHVILQIQIFKKKSKLPSILCGKWFQPIIRWKKKSATLHSSWRNFNWILFIKNTVMLCATVVEVGVVKLSWAFPTSSDIISIMSLTCADVLFCRTVLLHPNWISFICRACTCKAEL